MPTLEDTLIKASTDGLDMLRGGAAQGDYTLPAAFTDPYDALIRLSEVQPDRVQPDPRLTVAEAAAQIRQAALDDQAVPYGVGGLGGSRASVADIQDWIRARDIAADQLHNQAGTAIAYYSARAIIVEHLQPAFAARVEQFTADVATIGGFAGLETPTIQVVKASDKVRAAYVRFSEMYPWWASIRGAWAMLRQRDVATTDPHGVHGLLAEVANADQVAPNHWRNIRQHYQLGPWPSNAPHVRAAWIVNAGGKLWCPTAAEQSQAWAPFAPDPTPFYLRGSNTNPRATLAQMAGH